VISLPDDADLLALNVATLFVLTESGRILHDNAPDRSPGPRFYVGGCATSNVIRVRHDVGPDTAQSLERLASEEPPLRHPGSNPVHVDEYVRLLAAEAPIVTCTSGLTWSFASAPSFASGSAFLGGPSLALEPRSGAEAHPMFTLVASGTLEGDHLLARLAREGMPTALRTLGFTSASDFWPPWCVALQDGEIASIAFASRLTPVGAETGVATVPELRGRGLAAAATAGWAAHPDLRGHRLFYSTSRTNLSSQRVAARLGLRFLGASFSIT
jgi:hypothetical protein